MLYLFLKFSLSFYLKFSKVSVIFLKYMLINFSKFTQYFSNIFQNFLNLSLSFALIFKKFFKFQNLFSKFLSSFKKFSNYCLKITLMFFEFFLKLSTFTLWFCRCFPRIFFKFISTYFWKYYQISSSSTQFLFKITKFNCKCYNKIC